MKKILKGKITDIKRVCSEIFELKFTSPLSKVEPGEFLSILCPPKTLRRPFSIAGFEDNILRVLIREKGEGTKYLSSRKIGDEIDFLAPLGHGFKLENKRSLLVGAGIGVAPLFYLNKKLKTLGVETLLVSGFRSEEDAIEGCDKVKIGGSVLDELPEYVDEFKPEKIYTCGPEVVLKAISRFGIERDIPVEVAMEKIMACGIGVCRGCIIQVRKKNAVVNASICHDGPVFAGDEVIWD